MIFLGAGASKAFGVKTMQDLTDDLVEKLKDKGYAEAIDDIIDALKAFRITPDFENIYTTLEALVNPIDGVKESGGFTAYIAAKGGLEHVEGHPEFEDILIEFRNLIYNECSIKRGVMKAKTSFLDKLFDGISAATHGRAQHDGRCFIAKTGRATRGEKVNPSKTIVTTNYDMAIEFYHRLKKRPLADGFKQTTEEYTKTLDLTEYSRLGGGNWLIKLHGSIWQFKQGARVIQTIAPLASLPLEISVGENMMIYPVGEKPILQEPYFSFYSLFKEQLWRVLIVIGYSFRDAPVNTAILERLSAQEGPNPKLIVINPHADDVIKHLGEMDPALQKRIIRINEPFRDDDTLFVKLANAIISPDQDTYKDRNARVLS